ncbi:hypothetical protein NFI96_017904, partial [Prochilodus magdalenae]
NPCCFRSSSKLAPELAGVSLHFQSSKMSGLLRGLARVRTAPALRGSNISQRANIATKPAKDALGAAETTIGLALFSVAILVPSGWVLANLESYKKKA